MIEKILLKTNGEILLVALGVCGLTSCATHYPDLNNRALATPIQDSSMSEIASFRLSERLGFREELRFLRLDSDRRKQFESKDGIYQVPPGKREVRIQYAAVERGRLIREAFGDIELNLESGKRYIPYGKGEGRRVQVWMIDALSGERVSEIVTFEIEPVVLRDIGGDAN